MKLNVKDYQNNDVVRILREYSSMTQKEMAEKLNKSVRSVQRYESGKHKVDFSLIRDICELCDLTLTIESKSTKKQK